MKSPLIRYSQELADSVDLLTFGPPVAMVYNPLRYAWAGHRAYLQRYGAGRKRVILMGMNPGPWGMAQTGVPFGEVAHARDWLGIDVAIEKPPKEHPKRPIEGFACARSEVSGRRLWSLFAEHFESADAFFADHLVVNYCPLVFMGETGRNITPDKLPAAESRPLGEACDRHLSQVIAKVRPEWLVGVGAYAEACLKRVAGERIPVARILHPSPASPAANRDWAGTALRQFREQGIWT